MKIPGSGQHFIQQRNGLLSCPCRCWWSHPASLLIAILLCAPGIARGGQGAWPLADWPEPPQIVEEKPQQTGDSQMLVQAIDDIANQLSDNLQGMEPGQALLADGLVVCSFAELKKLTRTSSFGRYLADGLMNAFQQRQFRVVEVRKTTDILIQAGRGEYGLSRDPARIRSQAEAGAMLTGTYTLAEDKVLVNARIVDNRDATVLSSASIILPATPLVRRLLADKATARSSGEREYVYVKKLAP